MIKITYKKNQVMSKVSKVQISIMKWNKIEYLIKDIKFKI